jgi:hypothetical protein
MENKYLSIYLKVGVRYEVEFSINGNSKNRKEPLFLSIFVPKDEFLYSLDLINLFSKLTIMKTKRSKSKLCAETFEHYLILTHQLPKKRFMQHLFSTSER